VCLTGFSTVRQEESLGCIVPNTTADAVASGNEGGGGGEREGREIHTYLQ